MSIALRKAFVVVAAVLGPHGAASGQEHSLQLLTHTRPVYPPLAVAAKLERTASVQFQVDAEGRPYGFQATSAIPMFATSAESHVRSWRFAPPAAADVDRTIISAFTFALDEWLTEQPYGPRSERYEISPDLNVFVWSGAFPQLLAESCPDDRIEPPQHALIGSDYVELGRGGCYGTCPPYTLRVSADGAVEWDGRFYVDRIGRHSYHIDPQAARDLIETFRTPEVWNLCEDYSRSVTDSPTEGVEISIGGRKKTITDYASSSPQWFRDLLDTIDGTANSHDYRHGSPESEALEHIRGEWLPKPGKTKIMDVAIRGEIDELRRLLDSGEAPNAVDSSGWSVLMYAAASHNHWGKMELLVERGANAKHVSRHGDTVLMASALRGGFNEDLARRTGGINAQNRDGVSVLMLLAAQPDRREIKQALAAGADPTLRDAQGRSALEYLAEENCFRHAVRGRQDHMTITSTVCNALGEAYRPIKRLLTQASGKWRRRR